MFKGDIMFFVIILALSATTFTWLLTALGASSVIFFKKSNDYLLKIMLGFSSGVMIAASFWSLLSPAIKNSSNEVYGAITATFGLSFGTALMIFIDKFIISFQDKAILKNKNKNLIMLILSITIHNIPEGLAVGVAFGALKNNFSLSAVMSAISIAVGIGVQNFPEGAAVSIPLKNYGYSNRKSFMIGQASALVEPIFGVLGAVLVFLVNKILPFCLSFAAGCMIYVVVNELVPLSQNGNENEKRIATVFFIAGFIVMMLLDVIL